LNSRATLRKLGTTRGKNPHPALKGGSWSKKRSSKNGRREKGFLKANRRGEKNRQDRWGKGTLEGNHFKSMKMCTKNRSEKKRTY